MDKTGPHLDQFFTYAVPVELRGEVKVGQYLRLPWGKKTAGGVCYSLSAELPGEVALDKVKPVLEICHPEVLLSESHWQLLFWLRKFYYSTLSESLRCLFPAPVLEGLRRGTKPRVKAEVQALSEEPSIPNLTPDQAEVWGKLSLALGETETFLLHGVTGSGKTEIYLRATALCLERQKQALVLVPEVSLTPQTQARYRARFGAQVSILHSGLTPAQRREQWWRIHRGEAQVVVGTRSAIFAPLKDCGLIVLDEEHDSSYKQGSQLRYHARQVAIWLSRKNGFPVLLGSATPSLESYSLARKGVFTLLELPRRVSSAKLPQVRMVEGDGLTHEVLLALKNRRELGQKSVILLNRRGYSNYLQCGDCTWVAECRHCSVSMSYHQKERRLRCHYCGASQRAPSHCQECGSTKLDLPGQGTERIEQELATRLPDLRVARLDRDTVRGRAKVFESTFEAFGSGEIDCLLGTQMVAKGLDFPEVTLVVVLAADTGLHMPDFRASERSFSLLTQVAGRAGRGEVPGEVLVVTRRPQTELFSLLAEHQWTEFMASEMRLRQEHQYPPSCRLLRLLMSDTKEKRLESFAMELAECLDGLVAGTRVSLSGPSPCPLEKLQSRYRWHLLLRGPSVGDLQSVIAAIPPELRQTESRLILDPDPLDLM